MVDPKIESWTGAIVSGANLDATTYGVGTTTQRLALSTWPTGRLFFDTTLNQIYINTGSSGSPSWTALTRDSEINIFGTGADDASEGVGTTISTDTSLSSKELFYTNLTVNAGQTLTLTNSGSTIIYVKDTLTINGTVTKKGKGRAGSSGGAGGSPGGKSATTSSGGGTTGATSAGAGGQPSAVAANGIGKTGPSSVVGQSGITGTGTPSGGATNAATGGASGGSSKAAVAATTTVDSDRMTHILNLAITGYTILGEGGLGGNGGGAGGGNAAHRTYYAGGAFGEASSSGGTGGSGGAGGQGGGFIMLFCKNLVFGASGVIDVSGNNGTSGSSGGNGGTGSGSGTTGPGGAGSGGNGGCGGFVFLVTSTITGLTRPLNGTQINIDGGTAGAAVSGSTNQDTRLAGNDGTVGQVFELEAT